VGDELFLGKSQQQIQGKGLNLWQIIHHQQAEWLISSFPKQIYSFLSIDSKGHCGTILDCYLLDYHSQALQQLDGHFQTAPQPVLKLPHSIFSSELKPLNNRISEDRRIIMKNCNLYFQFLHKTLRCLPVLDNHEMPPPFSIDNI
jgi:hypothetical protein